MRLIFLIIIGVIFIVGIVLLQIFLSKKKKKWLGLVLPFICFWISIFVVYSPMIFNTGGLAGVRFYNQYLHDRNIIRVDVNQSSIINLDEFQMPSKALLIFWFIAYMLLFNIPTVILLVIYAACRKKGKKSLELQKMSIQDLG